MAEYEIPDDLLYSSDDEWARIDGDRVTVGITDYAQQQLGDIVFVELPKVGARLTRGSTFGVVESVKAVSDLYAPVSGEVLEVNAELADRPEQVNEECYGDGWMIVIGGVESAESDRLLDAESYRALVDERSE